MPTSYRKISQQVIGPTVDKPNSIGMDNNLQLDQKVNILFGISNNLIDDISKIKVKPSDTNKNLLISDTPFYLEKLTDSCVLQIIQGSNYATIFPKNKTIYIGNNTNPSHLIIENVEFFSENDYPILDIQLNSKVLFKNCVFRKVINIQGGATSSFVNIASGSKVSFVGCWFIGMQTNGNVIVNAGLPADVTVNGGFNSTTRTHSNATIFGELT